MLVIYPNTILFLGAFTKLWKATISFYVSVSNSVAATGETPIKFDIWEFFKNYFVKIKVSLKHEKNNGYFMWKRMYI